MTAVSWINVRGDWDQYKGQVKQRWAKLTDDDLLHIGGDRDLLISTLQLRYGLPREQLEQQVDDFAGAADTAHPSWMDKAKHKLFGWTGQAKAYFQHHKVGELVGEAENCMRRHPVPTTLAGIGVGFLLGLVLTRSRTVTMIPRS